MKYIDADRLRAEIEKTYKSEIQPWLSGVSATSAIYDYILPLINSLQQEQPELPPMGYAETYYQKGLHDGIIKGQTEILKRFNEIEKRKAEPFLVIKDQEQPEVDLEIERIVKDEEKFMNFQARHQLIGYVARHFAEWQKEQDDKDLSEKIAASYQLGLADNEMQMLSEAVDGVVTYDNRGNNVVRAGEFNKDLEYGDKVRVIIVKDGEK